MQNNFNPYNNPYGFNPNPYTNLQPRNNTNTNQQLFYWVNGIEGAKAYQMQPNQSIMLMDSDEPIVYKKESNNYGQATIQAFRLVPIQEETKSNQEYVLKADFESLNKKVEELMSALKKDEVKGE